LERFKPNLIANSVLMMEVASLMTNSQKVDIAKYKYLSKSNFCGVHASSTKIFFSSAVPLGSRAFLIPTCPSFRRRQLFLKSANF
jgi:hypothetical protein